MEQQVVAHTATDEALLDAGQSVDSVIYLEQLRVVGVEVGAHLRMDARRALADGTGFRVVAVHAVHVSRRTAEVGEVALEVGHLYHLLHLLHDAALRSACNELALMRRDCAESATAEASAMQIDRELYHLVSRYALALILRMRQSGVRQVERAVELVGCHRRIRRIDNGVLVVDSLQQSLCVHLVRLLLDMSEVFCLRLLVAQALLMAVQHYIVGANAVRNLVLAAEINGLRNVVNGADWQAFGEIATELNDRFLAHSVDYHVGARVAEYALLQRVLPVVVVRQAAQRRLDAAEHDGHVGEELLQNLCIYNGRILRAAVVTTVRAVRVFGAQALAGCVFVHHRVHASRRYSEEQIGATQLLEVAEVAVPVGLRNNSHGVARSLKCTTNHCGAKRGMIHVGVGREENDVYGIPSTQLDFFLCSRQPVGEPVFFHCILFSLLNSPQGDYCAFSAGASPSAFCSV